MPPVKAYGLFMTNEEMAPDVGLEIVHVSNIIKRPLVDEAGERLGRVQDLVARVRDAPHPPVVGLVVKVEGRDLFVPISKIGSFDPGHIHFDGKRVDLRRFERRPGELLLGQDLLARHLINFVGGRLVRANEIELAKVDDTWEVVGVDPSSRPALRRLLPSRLRWRTSNGPIVDWASVEPFVAHVPSARLRIPYRKLKKVQPAQIDELEISA